MEVIASAAVDALAAHLLPFRASLFQYFDALLELRGAKDPFSTLPAGVFYRQITEIVTRSESYVLSTF